MKTSLNKKINEVYVDPLPYNLGTLPIVHLHNPFSMIHFLWVYFCGSHPSQPTVHGAFDETTRSVRVTNPYAMNLLWSRGFFGKGSLSRSEPSWFGRTSRRLGLDGGELTFEELTEIRRAERRKFKKERDLQEKRELMERRRQEGEEISDPIDEPEEPVQVETRQEDIDLIIEDPSLVLGKTIQKLEYVELMPCEALFLATSLGILEVHDDVGSVFDLSKLLSSCCSSRKLFYEYLVYHYFRSKGWCVRSGVKFGTDFILYRRGPPFQHAEFAVMILAEGIAEDRDWWWSQSISRVVGSVKKQLIFAYVVGPDPVDLDFSNYNSIDALRGLLKQYSVQTVLYSRWAPNRTRD